MVVVSTKKISNPRDVVVCLATNRDRSVNGGSEKSSPLILPVQEDVVQKILDAVVDQRLRGTHLGPGLPWN